MMKGRKAFILFTEKIKWLLLLIIPCVLLIEFTSEKQPYFWDNRYDPSYAYLLNGLNLSLTHGNVGHIDHPGTTVQVMAAFIIKVTYQFRNKSIPMAEDVLRNPEFYLRVIALCFTFGNILLLVLLGFIAFKATGEIIYGLLFQSLPFLFNTYLRHQLFYEVKPEPILFSVQMILISVFLIETTGIGLKGKINTAKWGLSDKIIDGIQWKIIVYAVLIGFCLTTKIHSFPLFFFPFLMIQSVRNKILYSVTTLLSFLFFTIPIWVSYPKMFTWIYELFLHSGRYGKGPADIVDKTMYFVNLIGIFKTQPIFTGIMLASFLVLIVPFFKRGKNLQYKYLLAIFMVEIFAILLISKQYKMHYLISIIPMSMLNIYLIFKLINRAQWEKPMILFFICISVLLNFNYHISKPYNTKPIETEKNALNIFSYSSADQREAFFFGNGYAKMEWAEMLNSIYPECYFYNQWKNTYNTWDKSIEADSLRKINSRIIVYGRKAKLQLLYQSTEVVQLDSTRFLIKP
ncbi:MAG: hypothetical protein HXX18_03990 [Bacteroidetes bacterium]|nr:hypothetical protein [Bacteroidota bacterium]